MDKSTVYTVSSLKKIVVWGFRELFDEFLFWCKAEVGSIKKYWTRRYIDLFEYWPWWKVAAKITWIVWQDSVMQAFLKNTGNTTSSIKWKEVMIQWYLSYHATYWLSVSILWFSWEFEKGKQIDYRKQVIESLMKRWLLHKNREKTLEKWTIRLALISSKQSEGLRDFTTIVDDSWFSFEYDLFQSKVDGDQAVSSITEALKLIEESQNKYDCIVLLRGGGGQEWFARQNQLPVCETVVNSSLPICVAVGHTADKSLLDELCFMSFKTPSDAAWWFVEKYSALSTELDTMNGAINQHITTLFLSYKNIAWELNKSIEHEATKRIILLKNTISAYREWISSFSPESVLKKWYALLERDWVYLSKKDIDSLVSWEKFSLKLHNKTVNVKID